MKQKFIAFSTLCALFSGFAIAQTTTVDGVCNYSIDDLASFDPLTANSACEDLYDPTTGADPMVFEKSVFEIKDETGTSIWTAAVGGAQPNVQTGYDVTYQIGFEGSMPLAPAVASLEDVWVDAEFDFVSYDATNAAGTSSSAATVVGTDEQVVVDGFTDTITNGQYGLLTLDVVEASDPGVGSTLTLTNTVEANPADPITSTIPTTDTADVIYEKIDITTAKTTTSIFRFDGTNWVDVLADADATNDDVQSGDYITYDITATGTFGATGTSLYDVFPTADIAYQDDTATLPAGVTSSSAEVSGPVASGVAGYDAVEFAVTAGSPSVTTTFLVN